MFFFFSLSSNHSITFLNFLFIQNKLNINGTLYRFHNYKNELSQTVEMICLIFFHWLNIITVQGDFHNHAVLDFLQHDFSEDDYGFTTWLYQMNGILIMWLESVY